MTMPDREFITSAARIGSGTTPLRKFWGTLVAVEPKFSDNRTQVELNFTGVEVLQLVPGAVYEYPIAQLSVRYPALQSDGTINPRSNWAKTLKSAEAQGFPDIKDLISRRVLMTAVEDSFKQNEGTEQETVQQYIWWSVERVDGVKPTLFAPAADPMQVALDLIHGHTAAEFAEAALKNSTLRPRSASIYDNSLLSGLIAGGKITLEADRYYVVGRPR